VETKLDDREKVKSTKKVVEEEEIIDYVINSHYFRKDVEIQINFQ